MIDEANNEIKFKKVADVIKRSILNGRLSLLKIIFNESMGIFKLSPH